MSSFLSLPRPHPHPAPFAAEEPAQSLACPEPDRNLPPELSQPQEETSAQGSRTPEARQPLRTMGRGLLGQWGGVSGDPAAWRGVAVGGEGVGRLSRKGDPEGTSRHLGEQVDAKLPGPQLLINLTSPGRVTSPEGTFGTESSESSESLCTHPQGPRGDGQEKRWKANLEQSDL